MESHHLNRKQFLRRAGLLAGAVAIPGQLCRAGLGLAAPCPLPVPAAALAGRPYRVAGLPERRYSAGFHRHCRRRFASAQTAAASVRNPQTEFSIVRD